MSLEKEREEIIEFFYSVGLEVKNEDDILAIIKKGTEYTEPKLRSLSLFKGKLTKLKTNRDLKVEVLEYIMKLMKDPYIGERKKGSLKGIRAIILKSISGGRLVYSYIKESNTIHLIAVGSHADIGSEYEVIKKQLGKKLRYYNKKGS
ncbi:type II toxin-antitoxin system mRNA interferase toxin, RelE/StbE family [Kosmotoga sp. DU53]|uniref:type II toxin-antitoxin system mRNA interferase toxin, RelE/StbE family n=1 Tax=Kosmotoga sp. DU53 TaxID=1310160 RepID=UPI0007C44684|nr:type II toxin-antitoxin system mRNA interferase toxin, RelE/StbE family [Kosmotoga sp. DU53]OAA19002.1 hypothetical protein DU53_11920 [Kosmotoga sp. DU53]